MWARGQRKAKIPVKVRWEVWRRDNFTCHYCGSWGENLSLDHVVPETYGGQAVPENLWTACSSCNRKKSTTSYKEFIESPWLKKKRLHTSIMENKRTQAMKEST